MRIVRFCLMLACSLSLADLARADDSAILSRESFNRDWRFERFGPMPDGSTKPEPGGPGGWSVSATASSEELDKGNVAQNAFDGDTDSRWCASGPGAKQWVALDLGRETKLGGIQVDWEFPDMTYKYVVEGSTNGRNWKSLAEGDTSKEPKRLPLSASVRYVRVRATALPDTKWASIAEIRLFDADNKPIQNRRLESTGGKSPSAADFDDAGWRKLDVPHDWGIEGPFRDDLPGDTGKLPWKGIGWYRKHFTVPAADQDKKIFIDFDGAMANAKVWLNGEYVGTWPYGYNAFRLELTPFVKFGKENTLAVQLDTVHWGSRWYPGAGIYRNVWLVKTAPVHVGHWGVQVTTPTITEEKGDVKLSVTVDNQGEKAATVSVQADIYELAPPPRGVPYMGIPSGKMIKEVASSVAVEKSIGAGGSAKIDLAASVLQPRLWNLDKPNLYAAVIIVKVGGKIVDVDGQSFGFRTIEFTARDGFKLNGRRVQLNGTCNHHDLGALGSALNVRALERQLEILKEMGDNALRTSHNPPAPELLELADRMGFVVMVEAFDCWKAGKTANDYSRLWDKWHEKDLQAMVRRERNHPSVVMWSIGNEIAEQGGPQFSKMLGDIVRAEDPTRPVTAGCNNANAALNGFQTGVDIFGLNYNTGFFPRALSFPGNEKKPMYSSESSSCISSRGEYFFPVKRGRDSESNFQVSSYDVDYPGWAQSPDQEFEALDRSPAFMGEFVWTGFDYLGEPTPYNSDVTNLLNFSDPEKRAAMKKELEALGKMKVPSASSYFGIVDLCGFKKDRFYIYQARWRPELPMAHILPHWNWPERVGQVTPVHVYTSGDAAELFLNGKSLGKKQKGKYEYRLRWDDVEYQPGELKVVAYRDGKPWANDVVKTTSEPAKLLLSADRPEIRSDGQDLSFVTVTVADKDGLMVPRTHNLVKFAIEGPGEIVAVGNGDAASHEPFQAKERKAFNGLCQVIVRAKPGQSGPFILKAQSENLPPPNCGLPENKL